MVHRSMEAVVYQPPASLCQGGLGFLIQRWPQATLKTPSQTGSGGFIFRLLIWTEDGEREEGKAEEREKLRTGKRARKGKSRGEEEPGFPAEGKGR